MLSADPTKRAEANTRHFMRAVSQGQVDVLTPQVFVQMKCAGDAMELSLHQGDTLWKFGGCELPTELRENLVNVGGIVAAMGAVFAAAALAAPAAAAATEAVAVGESAAAGLVQGAAAIVPPAVKQAAAQGGRAVASFVVNNSAVVQGAHLACKGVVLAGGAYVAWGAVQAAQAAQDAYESAMRRGCNEAECFQLLYGFPKKEARGAFPHGPWARDFLNLRPGDSPLDLVLKWRWGCDEKRDTMSTMLRAVLNGQLLNGDLAPEELEKALERAISRMIEVAGGEASWRIDVACSLVDELNQKRAQRKRRHVSSTREMPMVAVPAEELAGNYKDPDRAATTNEGTAKMTAVVVQEVCDQLQQERDGDHQRCFEQAAKAFGTVNTGLMLISVGQVGMRLTSKAAVSACHQFLERTGLQESQRYAAMAAAAYRCTPEEFLAEMNAVGMQKGNWRIDETLSNPKHWVLVNDHTKELTCAFRGSGYINRAGQFKILDSVDPVHWPGVAVGAQQYSPALEHALTTAKEAMGRYPSHTMHLTGHSLGGVKAEYVAWRLI